ncbi:hypothetical protein C1645_838873 [Glomus cerebriforme]|uniref:Uncharacterized protein n=1 Tax=Glomus cerebriforme TaxID=658196 RepID=A0A397S1L5_9GLOM|nr:hypothetical protein C1645_838873 [Glomus cerebriforme]
MTSSSKKKKCAIYFNRHIHQYHQRNQSENLDEALADTINNMYIGQNNESVPRE